MKVSLIGAGPGDPGLITARGLELLSQADVIIYDALANPALLKLARPDAETIYVGKVAGRHALPQEQINRLLVEKAREKGHVARLKGGDPYIFGRGGEEGEYLAAHDVEFEVVPGITSVIAAPAYAGIPLTHRDYVSSLTIITGHESPEKAETAHDWQAFVKSGATLVFVMGMKNLAHICANLLTAGMDPEMPAAVIQRGTTPLQRTVTAPLHALNERAAQAGLGSPAVIVVGRVVALANRLNWFDSSPLLGRGIVVTRSREQASGLVSQLTALGADVLEFPTIEIFPMRDYAACDAAIEKLASYRWLIFTSVNGVKWFWSRLAAKNLDSRSLCACKVAAIGPATAASLASRGVRADLVPSTYVAEQVAAVLISAEGGNLAGMRILLPRAADAREILPEMLTKAGATVDVVPVYDTRPAQGNVAELKRRLESGAIDCIAFGSSSTVRNLLKLIPAESLKEHVGIRLAAIGPITADELRKHGLKPAIQPVCHTIPGLVDAIVASFRENK